MTALPLAIVLLHAGLRANTDAPPAAPGQPVRMVIKREKTAPAAPAAEGSTVAPEAAAAAELLPAEGPAPEPTEPPSVPKEESTPEGQEAAPAGETAEPEAGPVPPQPKKKKARAGRRAGERPLREVEIKSDSLEVLAAARQMVFSGNVVAVSENMRVTCHRSTAKYDEANRIRNLTCQGNAHVLQRPRKGADMREAWGEIAFFDNERSVLTVTGSPRAREGPNTMEGTKVTFLVNENRLLVDNAHVVVEQDGQVGKGVP